MSLVLPREEEVENIFSRILSSNESCERLLETFYDHLCDDNRFMDPDPHHFAEVLLNAYKNGDVSALLLEICNRSMFDLLKEAFSAIVFYGQETGSKSGKFYDELGVLLPIREFESTMLHHLGVIDDLVLSCREKMIKTADSNSLDL